MKKLIKLSASIGIASVLGLLSNAAVAGPFPTYLPTYPSPNSACATYGNFVSCSTKVLDYLAAQNTPGFVGPYGFGSSQGALIDTIVLASNNGNILNNGDQVNPSENGFTTSNGGQKKYFFTGDANDPTNNGALSGDTPYSWDIGLSTLNGKLTFGGAYHNLLVAFDFNNPQNSTSSLPVWALVTLRDKEGNLANKYFETQQLDTSGGAATIFKDPSLFQSTKTFNGTGVTTPGATDFALTIGAACVVSATNSYPSPDGSSCPSGGTLVNTNQASNEAEFINYIPSMDLLALEAQGYDTMSVQVWMGCFGTGANGAGPNLTSGSVGPCDTGGFGDIFLIAGPAAVPGENVPEPGTLTLMSLALLAVACRRKVRS